MRAHCVECRRNARWRETLARAKLATERDFECPHGVTAATAPATQMAALAEKGVNAGPAIARQVRQEKCCAQQ